MKQAKNNLLSLLGIIAGIFAVAFVMASCKTEVEPPAPITYTVTYSSADYGTTPEAITVEENTVLSASQLPELSDDAAVFKGWYIGYEKINPGYRVTRNVTLVAKWSQLATVTYHSKFGTVPESFEIERNQTLTLEKLAAPGNFSPHRFMCWFYSEDEDHNGTGMPASINDVITDNTDLYAGWLKSTISFSTRYGTTPASIQKYDGEKISLPVLTADGYNFGGWLLYNNVTYQYEKITSDYTVVNDETFTALWTATATYHSKFGTVPEPVIADLTTNSAYSASLEAPANCSPYTFLGWYDSEDDGHNGTGTQIKAGLTITRNTDLYAKWKTATVSFSTEHGTAPASIKKYTGEKISETEIPTLTPRTGYTFDGWFNGSTKLTTDYTVNGDVAFTEKWTVNTYPITFKANGGAESDSTQSVTYGTTVKLNANTFTRDGWSFIGWNEAADGSGKTYSDEADFAMTEANGVTLYAQWDPNADRSTVADMIRSMTKSGTIAVKGWIYDDTSNNEYTNNTLREIDSALNYLEKEKPKVKVSLDLSMTTGLVHINTGRFSNCNNLTSVILPASLKEIWNMAFYKCSSLTSITIPSSVTSIQEYAFEGCGGLTGSITIPSGVTSIREHAFSGCSGLTSVTIPSGVTSIGQGAFDGCSGLTGSITIPSGVTSIGNCTFNGCSGLTSITIPSSVTSIGVYAFCKCSKLSDVTFADTESSWDYYDNSGTKQGTIGKMSATDTARNATLLKSTYYMDEWRKQQ